MEPPVVSCCKLEGELVILVVVFADVHIKAVGGDIVEGLALYLLFLCTLSLFDKTIFYQLILYLDEIVSV